jgi:hypothetical protein
MVIVGRYMYTCFTIRAAFLKANFGIGILQIVTSGVPGIIVKICPNIVDRPSIDVDSHRLTAVDYVWTSGQCGHGHWTHLNVCWGFKRFPPVMFSHNLSAKYNMHFFLSIYGTQLYVYLLKVCTM